MPKSVIITPLELDTALKLLSLDFTRQGMPDVFSEGHHMTQEELELATHTTDTYHRTLLNLCVAYHKFVEDGSLEPAKELSEEEIKKQREFLRKAYEKSSLFDEGEDDGRFQ